MTLPLHLENRLTCGRMELRHTLDEFLSKLYDYSEAKQVDSGIDEVIDHFDSLLQQDDWPTCDGILIRAEVSRLDDAVALAMLSMTLVAKDELSARAIFHSRLRRWLVRKHDKETAARLLVGLE